MFASVDLARRIDHAEARLSAEIAGVVAARRPAAQVFVEEIAGGVAAFAGNESPVNKLIGVGFDAPVDERALAAIEAAFDQRGARLQAEISTLADPSVHSMLCGRGYVLQGFENVLGRRITADDSASAAPGEHVVESLDDSEIRQWGTMLVDGFEQPDAQGVPGDQIPPRDVVEQVIGDMVAVKSLRRYVARIGGRMVAGASMRMDDHVAQFTGSATIRDFRRRGLQTTFIRTRLADAARWGCDVAVVTTAPGSKSQENFQKQGFSLMYSRALLVRPPRP